MNEEEIKRLIAETLGKPTKELTTSQPLPPQEPPQLPQRLAEPPPRPEPIYPKETPLDEYEALMIEAISWRVEAAEKTNVLLKTEKKDIAKMKTQLLQRCVNRLKIDVNKFNLYVDSNTKTIKIEKRV